jgi:hypothetical protein
MNSDQVPPDLHETLAPHREELQRRSRAERVHSVWLWIDIVTGPIAFLVVRIASIILLSHGCSTGAGALLGLSLPQLATAGVTILGALVTIGAGLVSWRIWRCTSLREDEVSTGNMPRVPFWALGGVLLCAFFLFAIVVNGVLTLALSTACA